MAYGEAAAWLLGTVAKAVSNYYMGRLTPQQSGATDAENQQIIMNLYQAAKDVEVKERQLELTRLQARGSVERGIIDALGKLMSASAMLGTASSGQVNAYTKLLGDFMDEVNIDAGLSPDGIPAPGSLNAPAGFSGGMRDIMAPETIRNNSDSWRDNISTSLVNVGEGASLDWGDLDPDLKVEIARLAEDRVNKARALLVQYDTTDPTVRVNAEREASVLIYNEIAETLRQGGMPEDVIRSNSISNGIADTIIRGEKGLEVSFGVTEEMRQQVRGAQQGALDRRNDVVDQYDALLGTISPHTPGWGLLNEGKALLEQSMNNLGNDPSKWGVSQRPVEPPEGSVARLIREKIIEREHYKSDPEEQLIANLKRSYGPEAYLQIVRAFGLSDHYQISEHYRKNPELWGEANAAYIIGKAYRLPNGEPIQDHIRATLEQEGWDSEDPIDDAPGGPGTGTRPSIDPDLSGLSDEEVAAQVEEIVSNNETQGDPQAPRPTGLSDVESLERFGTSEQTAEELEAYRLGESIDREGPSPQELRQSIDEFGTSPQGLSADEQINEAFGRVRQIQESRLRAQEAYDETTSMLNAELARQMKLINQGALPAETSIEPKPTDFSLQGKAKPGTSEAPKRVGYTPLGPQ